MYLYLKICWGKEVKQDKSKSPNDNDTSVELILRAFDIITVPSKKSYDILKDESDANDIRIIPSAINVARFTLTKEDKSIIEGLRKLYKLKGRKVLGYVGRVSLEKNIIELPRATLPNAANIGTTLLKHNSTAIVDKTISIENLIILVGKND